MSFSSAYQQKNAELIAGAVSGDLLSSLEHVA